MDLAGWAALRASNKFISKHDLWAPFRRLVRIGHREAERTHSPSSNPVLQQTANAGHQSKQPREDNQCPVAVEPAADQFGGFIGRHFERLGS